VSFSNLSSAKNLPVSLLSVGRVAVFTAAGNVSKRQFRPLQMILRNRTLKGVMVVKRNNWGFVGLLGCAKNKEPAGGEGSRRILGLPLP